MQGAVKQRQRLCKLGLHRAIQTKRRESGLSRLQSPDIIQAHSRLVGKALQNREQNERALKAAILLSLESMRTAWTA